MNKENSNDQDILDFFKDYEKNNNLSSTTPEESLEKSKDKQDNVYEKEKELNTNVNKTDKISEKMKKEIEPKPIEPKKDIKTNAYRPIPKTDIYKPKAERKHENKPIFELKHEDSIKAKIKEDKKEDINKDQMVDNSKDKDIDNKISNKYQNKEKGNVKTDIEPKDVINRPNKELEKKNIVDNKEMKDINNFSDKKDIAKEEDNSSILADFDTSDFITLDTSDKIEDIDNVFIKEKDDIVKVEKKVPIISKKEQKKLNKQKLKDQKAEQKNNDKKDKAKWNKYYNGFVLAEGEKIIKEYNCLKLINPKGNGIITITNKRLLCSTNELAETEINNITGIKSKYKSKYSWFKISMFLLLGGITAACILAGIGIINITSFWTTMPKWFRFIFYAVAGITGLIALMMITTVHKKEFNISFLTKHNSPFVVYSGTVGKIKEKTIRVRPGKESRYIVHEIGAILLETKNKNKN